MGRATVSLSPPSPFLAHCDTAKGRMGGGRKMACKRKGRRGAAQHTCWLGSSVCCSDLQCVAVCCSVLQCVAVFCSVLQCVAVCCSVCVLVHKALRKAQGCPTHIGHKDARSNTHKIEEIQPNPHVCWAAPLLPFRLRAIFVPPPILWHKRHGQTHIK